MKDDRYITREVDRRTMDYGASPPNISRQNRTSSFPWPSAQSSPSPAPNHPYIIISCFTLSSPNISYNSLPCSHLIPRDDDEPPISLSCISQTSTYQNCQFHLLWNIRHHDHIICSDHDESIMANQRTYPNAQCCRRRISIYRTIQYHLYLKTIFIYVDRCRSCPRSRSIAQSSRETIK